MKTYYGQYCRVESHAGGIGATVRQFLRAALYGPFLARNALQRKHRSDRHEWLRDLLEHRKKARKLVREFAL